ncbi:ABC transporter substrate-binding protein [Halovivax limisalsi]|uniref:ABC transporter substrate-binding protein n=1 Tax=Halovivax limisalsi TaxID=1453760 RepID=UPI001FFDC10B|nr:ABC transporter substrate-binding protein [Halovivax limisalsi]
MSERNDAGRYVAPTRRDAIAYGGTVAVTGLLAGCLGDESVGSEPEPTSEGADTERSDEPADTEDASYSVTLSPVGEVSFEEPPETVFTRLTHHAGMAFALGRGNSITAMHAPDYYDGLWNQYVERLPGVELDWSGLYSSWQPEQEKLYELDSDVHLADPAWIGVQDAWDRRELDEIAERIAPWFGNSLSDSHQEPQVAWIDDYEYYTLWEQFELVADAFRERGRYEALAAVHDDLVATIEAGVPPEAERPTVAVIAAADVDEIYTYPVGTPGFLNAHTRPLGPRDAFEGAVEPTSVVDFETLLEYDPDVILHLGGMEPNTDMAERRDVFADDPVASRVEAVENGRVYAQGARYQGPILNLFQLEMTAKQLYPDVFGEWPTYEDGPYPKIPEDERLFDRQIVADAIRGDR